MFEAPRHFGGKVIPEFFWEILLHENLGKILERIFYNSYNGEKENTATCYRNELH